MKLESLVGEKQSLRYDYDPGYARLVAALTDSDDAEHDELLTWVGGHFDPEGFDANRTNQALHAIARSK